MSQSHQKPLTSRTASRASVKSSAVPVAMTLLLLVWCPILEAARRPGDRASPGWVNPRRRTERPTATITLAGDERSPRTRPCFRAMAASKYEFRIRGRLSEPLLARFEMLESEVERVETVLHGPIRDQAELHGIIDRVQSLGLELIEVRRLPD
jgi:hypothetical protein